MSKKIVDAFIQFNFPADLREIFAEAEISRIIFERQRKLLDIFIVSYRVIHPRSIRSLEKSLSVHLDYKVIVHERYEINKEWDKLYPAYAECLLYLLEQENPFISNTLRISQVKVEGNIISYEVPAVGYEYIMQYEPSKKIENLLKERFSSEVEVRLYKKDEKNQILQEFIRNRDMETRMMAAPVIREVEKVVPVKKITEIPSGFLYGKKEIKAELTPVSDIEEGPSFYTIHAELVGDIDVRELRSGKRMLKFFLTDYHKTIAAKLFAEDKEVADKLVKDMKDAKALRVCGKYNFDSFDMKPALMVQTIQPLEESIRAFREDDASEKRIELHCHTQMSDMDGVINMSALLGTVAKWGHEAIAITDNGVVQAFPDAFNTKKKKKLSDLKIIYGMLAYMVDDERPIVWFSKGQSLKGSYVVFDIETTGLVTSCDTLTEIGAVKIVDGKITERFSEFINPRRPIPRKIQELTHITDDMVRNADGIETVLPKFMEFCKDSVLVAHNSDFDISFIKRYCHELGLATDFTYADTLEIARHLFPDFKRYGLDYLSKELEINLSQHHRAVYDAEATAEVLLKMFQMLEAVGVYDLTGLEKWGKENPINWEKQKPTQIMILVQTRLGLLNLYKMVSESHIHTFAGVPRLKKSYLRTMREGILIGATGGNNDFYQAFVEGRCAELIERTSSFYDYFELYPIEVARAYISTDTLADDVKLANLQVELYEYVKAKGKKVIASSAAKILNPEDEILRRILLVGKKTVRNADTPDFCYLRTTKEMLRDFSYFGGEVARELVITSPKEIADSLDAIEPVEPDKYAPVIENSDMELKELCFSKAHAIYGDPLPKIVEERLNRELDSIINNGFAVMYIIAQKLVKKSNDDGYLVGSRGSVGSSFAATMAGITEVNPLTAHYICPNCKYSDFSPPELENDPEMSGADLPDRNCPNCGSPLGKDGHDIPFETFLGFYGDKEPDIDLNFSGEYQSTAHEYTEEIFGKDNVYRAGTIGTLADKTAFGFVKNYFEEREIEISEGDINRYVQGCVGVRRTTGQHPGGIIVVPKDQEICKFTPIQKPANDRNSTIITTHFDYHSIDHNLLKLDILGHDDPTMIRFLEDLTGVKANTIPLDEPKVMSLFQSTEALGIKPEDIGGVEMGSLGVPEFGTDFVIQMLKETKPKAFSDLIRISGLSHGTDVWTNNGQEMIRNGYATITTVISTRDGIMSFLINKGMEKGLSFNIMESVRKGKGLTPEWEKAMEESQIPEWYIESCRRIKYMFPKAHAAAYVMMAFRIAYYKVYYPLEYYAAYFSIRATNFDYALMGRGRAVLEETAEDLKSRKDKLTKKEQEMEKEMRSVREMYARGFEFHKIDLYQADATKFLILDGKIMPSFSSINGMGDKAAASIVEARKEKPFLSVEDLIARTKITKTLVDVLRSHGILGDLPETNQISLF